MTDPAPAEVLRACAHLLPPAGRALDLACGAGRNALFLARCGLQVNAWDRDARALELLRRAAGQGQVVTELRDVVAHPPAPGSFDVIVVSRFLERRLCPALIEALRPQGLLYYQTFTVEDPTGHGPRNPAFRLAPGELLRLFAPLRLLSYREDGLCGDLERGLRGQAWLVGVRTGNGVRGRRSYQPVLPSGPWRKRG